jgi:hypothetical protein
MSARLSSRAFWRARPDSIERHHALTLCGRNGSVSWVDCLAACALVRLYRLELVRLFLRTASSIVQPQLLTTEGDGLHALQVKRLPWLHVYIDMKPAGGVDVTRDLEQVERTLLALSSPSSSAAPAVTTGKFTHDLLRPTGRGR